MSKKLFTAIYLGLWAALGAVLVYVGVSAGQSPWLMAGAVFVAFYFINGFLAYFIRARQFRGQGKPPPQFIKFLFPTEKFVEPVQFPAAIHVALGLTVILGGALLVYGGGVFVFGFKRPIGWLLISLGAAFVYVGYRVIRMRQAGRHLFGPLDFRIAGYVIALLSVSTLFFGIVRRDYYTALGALSGGLMAYWAYKSSRDSNRGTTPPNDPPQPTPHDSAAERTR